MGQLVGYLLEDFRLGGYWASERWKLRGLGAWRPWSLGKVAEQVGDRGYVESRKEVCKIRRLGSSEF